MQSLVKHLRTLCEVEKRYSSVLRDVLLMRRAKAFGDSPSQLVHVVNPEQWLLREFRVLLTASVRAGRG